jgi:phage-related protein (TIGR01555 family)
MTRVAGLMRLDAFQNALTGLGVYGLDKVMSHLPVASATLSDAQLEATYNAEGIAARIVDLPVDDAMRHGWRHVPPEPDEDAVKRVDEEWCRLGCWTALGKAWKWGRLYGGGALLLGVADLGEMSAPLVPERVRSLSWLLDLDRRDYQPARWYTDERRPEYGTPETYTLSTSVGQTQIAREVHETRMVRFGGALTPRRTWRELGYHDFSVLQRAFEAYRRFDAAWQSGGAMMQDASVGVLKITDLLSVIASGSKDLFTTRCQLMNLGLASSRVLPIDKEEDFVRVERSFTGVADMLNQYTLYLAANLGWPVTVLFGRSPSGLDATGESDRALWDAIVRSEQTDVLIPAAERLQKVVLSALGIDPTGWTLEVPPLREESAEEIATRRKLIADTDVAYIGAGVFTADEVALVRVQNGEWTDDAPVMGDEGRAAREAMLEQDYDRMSGEGMEEEKEPAAVPPALGGPMPPAMLAQQEAAKAAAAAPEDEETKGEA